MSDRANDVCDSLPTHDEALTAMQDKQPVHCHAVEPIVPDWEGPVHTFLFLLVAYLFANFFFLTLLHGGARRPTPMQHSAEAPVARQPAMVMQKGAEAAEIGAANLGWSGMALPTNLS